jgi:ATP-dependent DNA helicase PIF1
LRFLFAAPTGTGKSVLLREIIRELRRKWAIRPEAVAVTAATGIAACHIGGTTLHSWAGIGIGTEPADKLYVFLFGFLSSSPRNRNAR